MAHNGWAGWGGTVIIVVVIVAGWISFQFISEGISKHRKKIEQAKKEEPYKPPESQYHEGLPNWILWPLIIFILFVFLLLLKK